jgi:predicted O-methyltransferase YrrM
MNIDRTEKYIDLTQEQLPDYLMDVRENALENGIPIIRPSVQGLLRFLMGYAKPRNILEIGAAVGFSALLMHEYAPDAYITTIENYEPRLVSARDNFEKNAGSDADSDEVAISLPEDKGCVRHFGKITLCEGNAEDILPELETGAYDFIFLDAAKGQYIFLLPEIVRLLKKGGLLVSDNCMQDGDVIEPRYAVRRRDRTIHDRMREYLSAVSVHPELSSAILPMADGVTVSYRK